LNGLLELAYELRRTYHLQDVDPGHPIRRAYDALSAAGTEIDNQAQQLAELRQRRDRCHEWHRRMQQAESACAAAHAGRARTGSMSVGRALANAGAHHWKDRAEAAEAERDHLRAAIGPLQVALRDTLLALGELIDDAVAIEPQLLNDTTTRAHYHETHATIRSRVAELNAVLAEEAKR
jgi:hypothetical protein